MPDVISYCLFKDPDALKTPPSGPPPVIGFAPTQKSDELLVAKPAHQRKLSTEGGARMNILAPGAEPSTHNECMHHTRTHTDMQGKGFGRTRADCNLRN